MKHCLRSFFTTVVFLVLLTDTSIAQSEFIVVFDNSGYQSWLQKEANDFLTKEHQRKSKIFDVEIQGSTSTWAFTSNQWAGYNVSSSVMGKVQQLGKEGVDVRKIETRNQDEYVIVGTNNKTYWGGVSDAELLKVLKNSSNPIKDIWLRPGGGFAALFTDGNLTWNNLPQVCSDKALELHKSGKKIKQIEVDRKGNFLILYDKNGFFADGIPKGAWDKLNSLQSQGLPIDMVTWHPDFQGSGYNSYESSFRAMLRADNSGHANPANRRTESKHRFILNGIECIQSDDGSSSRDELYLKVYVDGKYRGKLGPRSMNERSSREANVFDFVSWTKEAIDKLRKDERESFWLMPCSYAFSQSVEIFLYEEDLGPKHPLDPDDFIGSFKVLAKDPETFDQKWNFKKHGSWDVVYTKTRRTDVDHEVVGTSKLIEFRDPVADQGEEGACVAFTVATSLATKYLKDQGKKPPAKPLFDAQALYRRRGGSGEGWFIHLCLNLLLKEPIPFNDGSGRKLQLLSYYYYQADGVVRKYYKEGTEIKQKEISDEDGNGRNKMRKVLKAGEPLMANFEVYEDFMLHATVDGMYGGIVTKNEKKDAGHAMAVVGYYNPQVDADDHQYPYWVCQNSWGADWGKSGLVKFAEKVAKIDDSMFQIGEYEIVK